MNNPIKTALVAFGVAGRFMHAPFLVTQPGNYEVIVVLERHKEDSKQLFPNAKIVRSIEELLAIREVELVITIRIFLMRKQRHLPEKMWW